MLPRRTRREIMQDMVQNFITWHVKLNHRKGLGATDQPALVHSSGAPLGQPAATVRDKIPQVNQFPFESTKLGRQEQRRHDDGCVRICLQARGNKSVRSQREATQIYQNVATSLGSDGWIPGIDDWGAEFHFALRHDHPHSVLGSILTG